MARPGNTESLNPEEHIEDPVAHRAFFDFIRSGNVNEVRAGLNRHPTWANVKEQDGMLPLDVAIESLKFAIVKLLVENGASFNEETIEYARYVADERVGLTDAQEDIADTIVMFLASRSEDNQSVAPSTIAAEEDDEPLTARELEEQKELFDEIDGESLREVRAILTQYPRLLNREFDADDDGLAESPLRRAVNTQNINLIRLLVDLEADVTSQILQYQREIVDEARAGEDAVPSAILRLLEGMEDEDEDEDEEVELTISELVARKKLHGAIETKDNVTAKAVLAQHPKLANIEYNGETPLTNAVTSRNLEFVKHLVENGVYIDEDDDEHAEYLATHTPADLSAEEKQLARDIADVIHSRVNVIVAARPVVPPLNIPPRVPAEPAAPYKLEVVEVSYTTMPTAYDMLEMEDIALFDLITSGEKMIFKVKDIYFSTDLVPLQSAMQDKSSTFYECKAELDGAPYTKDVHADTPYFRVQLNGNFTVPENHLQAALASKYSIFELVPSEKKLAFVASYASVQITPGKDGLGRQVNIVSSDHCQKGSQQVTYTLRAVTMLNAISVLDSTRLGQKLPEDIIRKLRKYGGRKTYRKAKKGGRKTRHAARRHP